VSVRAARLPSGVSVRAARLPSGVSVRAARLPSGAHLLARPASPRVPSSPRAPHHLANPHEIREPTLGARVLSMGSCIECGFAGAIGRERVCGG